MTTASPMTRSSALRLALAGGLVAVLLGAVLGHPLWSGGEPNEVLATRSEAETRNGSDRALPQRATMPPPVEPDHAVPGPWLAQDSASPPTAGRSARPEIRSNTGNQHGLEEVSPAATSSDGRFEAWRPDERAIGRSVEPLNHASPSRRDAEETPSGGGSAKSPGLTPGRDPTRDDDRSDTLPRGPFAPASFSQPEPATRYRVEPRDSFWLISERAYGSGAYFRALYAHNQSRFPRPDDLPEGALVDVPPLEQLRRLFPDLCPGVEDVAATTTEGTRRRYVTKPGETLGRVADEQLGDRLRWTEIYRLNTRLVPDHRLVLAPGTELVLPQDRSFAREAAVRAELVR